MPFEGTGISFPTSFDADQPDPPSLEGLLIKCVACLFSGEVGNEYDTFLNTLLNCFLSTRAGVKLAEIGVFATLAALGSLTEVGCLSPKGKSNSLLRQAFEDVHRHRLVQQDSQHVTDSFRNFCPSLEKVTNQEMEESETNIASACRLAFGLFEAALQSPDVHSVQPMIYCYLVFIKNLATSRSAMQLIESKVPWSLLVSYLNQHLTPATMMSQVGYEIDGPLPEDFQMRGQIFAESSFPATWFSELRPPEILDMSARRAARILFNAHLLAQQRKWIIFDTQALKFRVACKDPQSPTTATAPALCQL